MSETTRKPVTLWRYVVKSAKHDRGGVFVLGSDGYFSACSDFGNYAHWWRDHGEQDFRTFLLDCERDADYFIRKLHGGIPMVYDQEATLKGVQRHILENRRERNMLAATARKEWNWSYALRDSFECWYNETDLGDAAEFHTDRYDSDVVNFVTKIMPRLCVLLKEDLQKPTAEVLT